MSEYCIFHNPRCSKSRQALLLLQDRGVEVDVRLYLQDAPDRGELEQLLARLGLQARELLRKGEADYRERQLSNPDLSDADLIDAMVACPKLIERPIVIRGERAVVGRPPEHVLALLDD